MNTASIDMDNPVVAEVAPKLGDASEAFALSVDLQARPDTREDLERLFVGVTGPTRAEEGCWEYRLARNVEDENRYKLSEGWRDLAALDAHFKTPHGQALLSRLGPLLARPFTLTVLTPVEG